AQGRSRCNLSVKDSGLVAAPSPGVWRSQASHSAAAVAQVCSPHPVRDHRISATETLKKQLGSELAAYGFHATRKASIQPAFVALIA
ncbi:MAG: hypothetical protein AAAB11_02395, partial [Rhizobium giardinii]